MAQRLRCPGGRPSVSYDERVKDVAVTLDIKCNGAKTLKKHQPNHVAAS